MPDTKCLSPWEPPAQLPTKRLLPGVVGAEGLPSLSRAVRLAWCGAQRHPQPCRWRGPARALLPAERLSITPGHRGCLSVAGVGGSGGLSLPCVAGPWPQWGVLQWQAAAGGSVIDTATG